MGAAAVMATAAGAPPATPPGLGSFAFDNSTGTVEGAFVQFEAPTSGNLVANYTSDGTLFFVTVAVDGYTRSSEETIGSLYKVRGTTAEAQVHDNPNAIMKITLEPNATASFALGANVSVGTSNESGLSLVVSGSNRTGAVWWTCGNSSLSVAGGNGSFDVAAPSTQCFVFSRSHVESSPSDLRIAAAAGNMQVTAEVWVAQSNDFDAASYGAANIVVSGTEDGIVVSVDPRGVGPQSVVIRYVDSQGHGKVRVSVDGREVSSAADVEDALDATDDGGQAEHYFGTGAESGLLVVSLPDGQPHVIHIEGLGSAAPDLTPTIAGLALGVAVAGAASLALFRRRR